MYARRLVDEARSVKYPPPNWVPNEYAPDYCGGCGELKQLSVHNACESCTTWYCGCSYCRPKEQKMKQIVNPKGFLPNGSGPLPFVQYWRFRAECLSDIAVLMTANWRKMGIFLEAMSFNRMERDTGLPDRECTMTLAAETADKFEKGLLSLAVYLIDDCDDCHVIVQSMKLASTYDGKRDGPFSHDA